MSEPKVLPSPRHTVIEEFDKFERLVWSVLVDDPNLKGSETGGAIAPAFYVVSTPFTRDFVTGPLKRKAEHLLRELDSLTKIAKCMAITPDEMALLNTGSTDDSTPPSETMSRYLDCAKDLIKSILIDNPSFQQTTDDEGNVLDAECFSMYPMTASFVRDVLPQNATQITRIMSNACSVCSVMAVSEDERVLLDDIVNKLDAVAGYTPETEGADQDFSSPGMEMVGP